MRRVKYKKIFLEKKVFKIFKILDDSWYTQEKILKSHAWKIAIFRAENGHFPNLDSSNSRCKMAIFQAWILQIRGVKWPFSWPGFFKFQVENGHFPGLDFSNSGWKMAIFSGLDFFKFGMENSHFQGLDFSNSGWKMVVFQGWIFQSFSDKILSFCKNDI